MTDGKLLHVGILCYPTITQLDLTGPYEVLARMPNTQIYILWKDTSPVKDEHGFCITPDLALRDSLSWMLSWFQVAMGNRI